MAHCLLTMVAAGPVDAVLAVAEPLHADVATAVAAHRVPVAVESVPGRATRAQCLSAGLRRLGPDVDDVLVHDVHRPLASADLANRVLEGLRRDVEVVVPALGMVDSVKTVDEAGAVTETVDRSTLWSAQYPRGFRRTRLEAMLAAARTDGFDELDAARHAGIPVTLVEGDPDAFLVEIPRDVALADAIHACRVAGQR